MRAVRHCLTLGTQMFKLLTRMPAWISLKVINEKDDVLFHTMKQRGVLGPGGVPVESEQAWLKVRGIIIV